MAHLKQKQMTMLCRKWKWNSREIHHSCGGGVWEMVAENLVTECWERKRFVLQASRKILVGGWCCCWFVYLLVSYIDFTFIGSFQLPIHQKTSDNVTRPGLKLRQQQQLCRGSTLADKPKLYWHRNTTCTCRKIPSLPYTRANRNVTERRSF